MPHNKSRKGVGVATLRASQLLTHQLTKSKRNNRSSNTYDHRSFVGAGSDVVKEGRGRKDLVATHHHPHHLDKDTMEPKSKRKKDL